MATQQIDLGQEAVNLSKRLYWCETLGFGAITKFLDPFGDETDDEAEAVVVHGFGLLRPHDVLARHRLNPRLESVAASRFTIRPLFVPRADVFAAVDLTAPRIASHAVVVANWNRIGAALVLRLAMLQRRCPIILSRYR